jgi:putative solute:sodium symporter small subunit
MVQARQATKRPGNGRRRRGAGAAWGALLVWLVIVLGGIVAAPLLNIVVVWGFPLGYWMVAQGSLLLLLLATVALVRRAERREAADDQGRDDDPATESSAAWS